MAGVSLTFSVGGQLVFTGRQKFLNWTSLYKKLSGRWSNKAGKIIFIAGQFAQCPAFNETPAYGDHLCGFGQPSNWSQHNLCVSVWIGQWLTWHSLVSCPALRNSTPNWFSIGRVLSHPFRLLALALEQNSQRYCESLDHEYESHYKQIGGVIA